MNERLKELMLEAGYAAPEIAGRANKLAELIVRECAQVCLSQRDPANLNYKPSERFAEAVKQHFGVEE
jgi:hypothetical protein